MVSEYFHFRHVGNIHQNITLDEYINQRIENVHGKEQFDSMMEFYTIRSEPWLFYTSYERMKFDLQGVINEVCDFLNTPIDGGTMQHMLKHLSFEEMKNNPKTNHMWEFEQKKFLLNEGFK